MATVVDVMSGGRMILGLGTGSDRAEHDAYGFAMGTPGERTAGVRRALEVVTAMRANPDGATVDGVLDAAPNRPSAEGPPVWVAAHGPVLLRLAGRSADGIVAAWTDARGVRGPHPRGRRGRRGRRAPPAGPPRSTPSAWRGPSPSCTPGWPPRRARSTPRRPACCAGCAPAAGSWEPRTRCGRSLRRMRPRARPTPSSRCRHGSRRRPTTPWPMRCCPPPPPGPPRRRCRTSSPRDNLVHLLVQRHREAGAGDRVAAIDEDGAWTYDQLGQAAARAAGALAGAGVRRGDRVAIALRDGRPWLAGFLGTAWLGAVAVPVDPASPADRVRLILDDCEPALTLADPEVDAGGWPTAPAALLETGTPRPAAAVHPDDLAYLVYSSGSTGRPKGAMHAHRDMATGIDTYARHVLELGPEDRCHSAARLFTSLGFGNGFFRVLGSGAIAVLSGARPNPRTTLAVVADHRVNVLTGVPTFWAQLAEFLARHPQPGALAGVRLAVASGDSLPAPVAARLEELTGLRIVEGLGCSECSNVLISTRSGERGGGTLGSVVPGVEVELRDPDGRVSGDGEPFTARPGTIVEIACL